MRTVSRMLFLLLAAGVVSLLTACSGGRSDPFAIDVQETLPLTVETQALQAGKVGVVYTFQLSARGGIPGANYRWTQVSNNGLPLGLSLNPFTGVISGIPRQTWNPGVDGQIVFNVDDNVNDAVLPVEAPAYDLTIDGDGWAASPGLSEGQSFAPGGRYAHSSVFIDTIGATTFNEMVVWGGVTEDMGTETFLNDGSTYLHDNVPDSWAQPVGLSAGATNAPTARGDHAAVWADNFMIVWGGRDAMGFLSDGAIYTRQTDTWSQPAGLQIGAANSPSARAKMAAVWDSVNQRMYIYGGEDANGASNELFSYDPTNDVWDNTLANSGASLSARYSAGAGFDSDAAGFLYVLCGEDGTDVFNDGAVYDVAGDSWSQPAALLDTNTNGLSARHSFGAAVSGRRLVCWGGHDGTSALSNGDIYDMQNGEWVSVSNSGSIVEFVTGAQRPSSRARMTAVKSPNGVLFFGGIGVRAPTNMNEEWGEGRLYIER